MDNIEQGRIVVDASECEDAGMIGPLPHPAVRDGEGESPRVVRINRRRTDRRGGGDDREERVEKQAHQPDSSYDMRSINRLS